MSTQQSVQTEYVVITLRESLRSPVLWKKGIKTFFLYFLFVWLRHRFVLTNLNLRYSGGSWFGKDDQPFPNETVTIEMDQSRSEALGRMGDIRIHRAGGGDVVVGFDNLSQPGSLQEMQLSARHNPATVKPTGRLRQFHEAFTVVIMLCLSMTLPFWILATAWQGIFGLPVAIVITLGLMVIGYIFGL